MKMNGKCLGFRLQAQALIFKVSGLRLRYVKVLGLRGFGFGCPGSDFHRVQPVNIIT